MITEISKFGCYNHGDLSELEKKIDRQRSNFIFRKNIRSVIGSRILGSLWLILDPIVLSAVYLFVFSVIRSNPSAQIIFIGISMYRIFSSSIRTGISSVKDYSGGIKAERVRTRVIFHAQIKYRVFDNTMQSIGVATILLLGFGVDPIGVLAFMASSQIMGLVGEGIGHNLALICKRIPDINNVVSHFILLMFFASPVLYPLSATEGFHYRLNLYNPFTYFVEFARHNCNAESGFLSLTPEISILVISVSSLLAVRGFLILDKVRWEVSAWS